MCGRYAASKDPDALVEEFEVDESLVEAPIGADYNVAPTKPVYLVVQRRPKDSPADTTDVPRQLRVARWGLVPSWAKDPKIGSRMINARAESLAQKPAYRRAFAARRCLLPADGYYEWYQPAEPTAGQPRTKSGKARKQPFYIHRADGSSLAMAGLYEWWHDPAKDRDDPDAWLLSTVVVTTAASQALEHIHDRMPVVLAPEAWAQWLDPSVTDVTVVQPLLSGAGEPDVVAYPVATAVNDVRNNGAALVEPLALDGADEDPATLL